MKKQPNLLTKPIFNKVIKSLKEVFKEENRPDGVFEVYYHKFSGLTNEDFIQLANTIMARYAGYKMIPGIDFWEREYRAILEEKQKYIDCSSSDNEYYPQWLLDWHRIFLWQLIDMKANCNSNNIGAYISVFEKLWLKFVELSKYGVGDGDYWNKKYFISLISYLNKEVGKQLNELLPENSPESAEQLPNKDIHENPF